MQQNKITKAVIVAAGFGTRFLPASKVIPKVMFPVIDKPIIQLVVEEIVESGITDITIVVSRFTKSIIESHFRPFAALNELLISSGKTIIADELKKIENSAKFTFVEQKPGRIGTGMALLSVRELMGEEPFILSWSDEFYKASPTRPAQLMAVYEKYGGPVVGCIRTNDPKCGARFGFVVGETLPDGVIKASQIIEKPGEGKAPSEMATMSGQVITPEIFKYLDKAVKEYSPGKEIYWNEAGLCPMLKDGLPVYALEYKNCCFYNTGDKFGYLKTLVEIGLKSPDFGEKFKEYLKIKASIL